MSSARYLDRRGFIALLRAARERRRLTARRDWWVLYFLGRTGLRVTELCRLQVKDLRLDTDPAFVSVATLKQRRPVTDQVLLEPRTVKACKRYLSRTLPRLLRRQPEPGDPILPAPTRLPVLMDLHPRRLSARNVSRIFQVYRRRAKLRPGLTCHSLRHYRGTQLYRDTGDLEFTRQQLRHRFLSSTQRYLHVDPERERHYLAKLDRH